MKGSTLDRLGIRTWINAAGYLTRLGGNELPEEVSLAMSEATGVFVDIAELQAIAAGIIARYTGAESGIITAGAAAALTLGAAACMARLDPARIDALPHTADMPSEFIMMRAHRSSYDHAIRAAGAKIVDVGVNDRTLNAGIRGTDTWEIENAISEKTAGFAFMANSHNLRELEVWARLAQKYSLPVLVDAAPWLPPVENLRRFCDAGASLVAFSGGKAIRGPQASGILCGQKELVASALLQQLDMNVVADNWRLPETLLPDGELTAIPRHGIGRGFKVSKETIVGLIVALERFVVRDHQGEFADMEGILRAIADGLVGARGLRTELSSASTTYRRPALELHFDEISAGVAAKDVARQLGQSNPPIQLTERLIAENILIVDPACLRRQHVPSIVSAIREILKQSENHGLSMQIIKRETSNGKS